jgi:hypothetical protein
MAKLAEQTACDSLSEVLNTEQGIFLHEITSKQQYGGGEQLSLMLQVCSQISFTI